MVHENREVVLDDYKKKSTRDTSTVTANLYLSIVLDTHHENREGAGIEFLLFFLGLDRI